MRGQRSRAETWEKQEKLNRSRRSLLGFNSHSITSVEVQFDHQPLRIVQILGGYQSKYWIDPGSNSSHQRDRAQVHTC
jgi:hypothetical protein